MNWDQGSQIFKDWLEEQRSKTSQEEANLKAAGATCQVCGIPLAIRYGRHGQAFFLIHPRSPCQDSGRTWHFDAKTEEEALASFVPDPPAPEAEP